jgi:hypothetical protein
MSTKVYYEQPTQDQWAVRVAHYVPWLTFWWFTQNWFPTSSVVQGHPAIFSPQDLSILSNFDKNEHQVHTYIHPYIHTYCSFYINYMQNGQIIVNFNAVCFVK